MAESPRTSSNTGLLDEPPRPLPRWSLGLLAGAHALVFAFVAVELPWSSWSSFTIFTGALALGHLLTAIAALARLRVLALVWRITSIVSLVLLAYLGWQLSRSASHLAGLYGSLGEGIGVALLAIIGLVALLTLPFACWGLAATWRSRWNRGASVGAGVLALIWSLGVWNQARAAKAAPLAQPTTSDADALAAELQAALPNWAELPVVPKGAQDRPDSPSKVPSLFTTKPVGCVPEPAGEDAVAVLTFLGPLGVKSQDDAFDPDDETTGQQTPRAGFQRQLARRGRAPVEVRSRCVRASPDQLIRTIAGVLEAEALRAPVVIDVWVAAAPLRSRGFVLDTLAIRPGLDGICDAEHCLMPWQLVATGQFVANEPAPWIPDFRYGISPVRLRHALGQPVSKLALRFDQQRRKMQLPDPDEQDGAQEQAPREVEPEDYGEWDTLDGLTRLETMSFTITTDGRVIPLVRMHEREPVLSVERLELARDRAEANIAASQLDDGRFRYIVEPFSGREDVRSWNLPRQAGTTLVVCELGRDVERAAEVADRSLAFMAKHARGDTAIRPLSRNRRKAGLGSTALPAIAFLTCRERGRVDHRHDPTIVGMIEYLLAMQREDGSFYPEWDLVGGAPIDGPEPMYAGGQAIFALSLAEKLAMREDVPGLPDAERLHAAVERAIAYYTGPYWDTFVRDFFWLEENWHCLAARASLDHHRNDAYEQFCIDYVSYKSRVPLDADSRVAPDFIGGYSMGNLLVPVNTPAAGHGEALAAAMALKQARGLDITEDRQQMRDVLGFLIRQQWSPDTCFACTPDRPVIGGFSESAVAPDIRIDFTQHAWAALGHGGALVIDELPASE